MLAHLKMMNSLLLNLIIAMESNLIVSNIQYVIKILNLVVREHVNLVMVVVSSIVLSMPKGTTPIVVYALAFC